MSPKDLKPEIQEMQETKGSEADEKIAVSSEFSTLPEVVPERPPPVSHPSQHSSYMYPSPYLHPHNGASSYTTPVVSPLTPDATGASLLGGRHRPNPPTPWSPGYFETLNPVANPHHAPLKPPPSYEFGEPPSPISSQSPLATGGYGPGHAPGYDSRPGTAHHQGMDGPPPLMPFEPMPPPPGLMMGPPPPPGGLGPVAAARRRRNNRLWIIGCVCLATLLCIIATVVGVLLGVVRINIKKNDTRGIDVQDLFLASSVVTRDWGSANSLG